jgi:RNase P/RNase MRP subunit POP5
MGVSMATGRLIGPVWSVLCGLLVMMAIQVTVGLLIRKRINRMNERIRVIMETAQQKISRKIQIMQQRQSGNMKMAQQMLEKDQSTAIREALAATEAAKPYYKWNLLLKKQISTMQMMLFYQLKEFDKVDALLPGCVFFDARSIAFKIARMYRKNDPALDKFFRKKVKRFKNDDAALLYSLYAFIKVKADDIEAALAALVAAKKVTDHPVILENWERLSNNKVKHFSNAALADAWYSLYLEEPKMKPQRVQQRMY